MKEGRKTFLKWTRKKYCSGMVGVIKKGKRYKTKN